MRPRSVGAYSFRVSGAGDAQQRQQNVGHQRGTQPVEGRPNRAVDLAGHRQDITGDKRRNSQQHACPGKTLGGTEHRRGIFEQSHRGQKTVHRTVQRIGIATDRCRFHAAVAVSTALPGGGCRGVFENADCAPGNFRGGRRIAGSVLLKQETRCRRLGLPSQPEKPLPNRTLRQPQIAGDHTVAGPFRFQMQNRLIPSPMFRTTGTAARWPSRLRHQTRDPVRREAFLVASESSLRVTEGSGDLGLLRVLRFPQRDHRIRFRSPILHAVVGEDDTVDRDHSLRILGPERHPVIHIDRAAWWRMERQKFRLLRGHC